MFHSPSSYLVDEDRDPFFYIFEELLNNGYMCKPRGQTILELRNKTFSFRPHEQFMDYSARKLNIPYIKKEFEWYHRGFQDDLSICNHAAIWRSCVNNNNLIMSNYGHYLFKRPGCNLMTAIDILNDDPDTRRAVIPFNEPIHNYIHAPDVPCTMYIQFFIRNERLWMDVAMRSQDIIFGLGNDLPWFQHVWQMALYLLKMPNLELGELTFHVKSLHLYNQHFDMGLEILRQRNQWDQGTRLPPPTEIQEWYES
jgi:thymidylate synthase